MWRLLSADIFLQLLLHTNLNYIFPHSQIWQVDGVKNQNGIGKQDLYGLKNYGREGIQAFHCTIP